MRCFCGLGLEVMPGVPTCMSLARTQPSGVIEAARVSGKCSQVVCRGGRETVFDERLPGLSATFGLSLVQLSQCCKASAGAELLCGQMAPGPTCRPGSCPRGRHPFLQLSLHLALFSDAAALV